MLTSEVSLDGGRILLRGHAMGLGTDPDAWINIFVNSRRMGWLCDSLSDGGWTLVLHTEWGAPCNHHQTYLTKEIALAHLREVLDDK